MKLILSLFFISFGLVSTANSREYIKASETNFSAERVYFNPVTQNYVVEYPYYIATNGNHVYVMALSKGPQQHLCKFLGFGIGQIIKVESSCDRMADLLIRPDGTFVDRSDYGHASGCGYHIATVECSAP